MIHWSFLLGSEAEKKSDEEEVIVEDKEDKDNKTDDENVSKDAVTDDENNSLSPDFATNSSEGQRSPPPSMVFGPNNPYLAVNPMMYINCTNPYFQVNIIILNIQI